MSDQIVFSADQLDTLRQFTNNGTSDFYKGYDYIRYLIASGQVNAGSESSKILYWLDNASSINSNDQSSSSNLFIRSITSDGLKWDGKHADPSDVQRNSNLIGQQVIASILRSSTLPDIDLVIKDDVSQAITIGGQTLGGWGGSFYYWNTPLPTQADPNATVGSRIRSDPAEYEKFIALNAQALMDEGMRDGHGLTSGELVPSLISTMNALRAAMTALNANVPPEVAATIFNRALDSFTTGTVAGDPNNIDGYIKHTGVNGNTNTLTWTEGRSGPVIMDPVKIQELNSRSLVREQQAGGAWQRYSSNENIDGSTVIRYADLDFNGNLREGIIALNASGDTIYRSESRIVDGKTVYDVAGHGQQLDVNNGEIYVAAGSEININGAGNTVFMSIGDSVHLTGASNILNAVAGDHISLSGTGASADTVNASGLLGGTAVDGQAAGIYLDSATTANVFGAYNAISVGSGSVLGAYGGGNDITAQSSTTVVIGNTGAVQDGVHAEWDAAGGTTVTGQASGIYVNPSSAASVFGNNNTVGIGWGSVVGVYGGANDITASSNSALVIGGTGAYQDAVHAESDAAGGSTVTGQATGISLQASSAASVFGSNNTVMADWGSALGVYGGSNAIWAQSNTLVEVGYTGGNFDAIHADGVGVAGTTVTGQQTGIVLDANTAANVAGSYDHISVGQGSVVGASGGANTIDASSESFVYVSNTGVNFDEINVSGDFGGTVVTGASTGVTIADDSAANVLGFYNHLTLGTSSVLGAYGGGNLIDAAANSLLVVAETQGTADQVNANFDTFGGSTVTGQGTGIYLAINSAAVVYGSGNGAVLTPFGHDLVSFIGQYNTVYGDSGRQNLVGLQGIRSSAQVFGGGFGILDGSLQSMTMGNGGGGAYVQPFQIGDVLAGNYTSFVFSPGTSGSSYTGRNDYVYQASAESAHAFGDTTGDVFQTDPFTSSNNFFEMADPLVLNLIGASVSTLSRDDEHVYFDMSNDGTPVRSGWITAGEGFLVDGSVVSGQPARQKD